MATVAAVMAPFFTVIIIVTRQAIGVSSPGDVILMLLVSDVGTRLAARFMARIVCLTAQMGT